MPGKRVVVAMSGGVDSSVAAAILKDEGYEIIGVTMQIWPPDSVDSYSGCCGLGAIEDARKVAHKLGIRHYVMDFREIFARRVIADFCHEYSRGRTPNPCIRCNQHIKFDHLLRRARELDADFMATGHYARVRSSADGYRLLKGVDPAKDQSYFLYTLNQQQLEYLLLPIGDFCKTEVRRMAAEMDLPTADSKESQDICFIPDGDYRSFIAEHVTLEAGDIVDTDGNILGRHRGLALYTVGQRQGLGLASSERRYVLGLDAASNRLIAGSEEQLLSSRLTAAELNWVAGRAPEGPGITAKIRYKSADAPVELRFRDDTAEVHFGQPQRAVAPGQAVVFYRDETVLGGGIIEV